MWFSFWSSNNRFSLEELRYLTEQLQKVEIANDTNEGFIVEALRSIAELVIYGDQHDSTFFDLFMEKQFMGEFIRLLQVSKIAAVPLQLLQTVSIIVQNLKNEDSIYYLFSNEHINYLITYPFDFQNEELLSYYISFLRAISGKLDRTTISLLVKTSNNEVVAFPLYVEALKFAFHEESMIRIAVRALTLNVYHVGDDGVNRYITSGHLATYFPDLITFFRKLCINLDGLVLVAQENQSQELVSSNCTAIDEIEDNLYYYSDIISAGIPDVGHLITNNLLQSLILPVLLPSLTNEGVNDTQLRAITAIYLLCSILRIVKIKDLANIIAAALFCPQQSFTKLHEAKSNGDLTFSKNQHPLSQENSNHREDMPERKLAIAIPCNRILENESAGTYLALWESLVFSLRSGNNVHVLGSLSLLAVLLQTKELDESMQDALGILPQRKKHKNLLLKLLAGDCSGEEQLLSIENHSTHDSCGGELNKYLRKLKEHYGVACSDAELLASPLLCRFQVLDAMVNLFCRSDISAEALYFGAWLLHQLLPYSEAEINRNHLKFLGELYGKCSTGLLQEVQGIWADQIIPLLRSEWRNCKKVIESSSSQRELKCLLMSPQNTVLEDAVPSESPFTTGAKMHKLVKETVLLYQLQICFHGRLLADHPPLQASVGIPENSRAKAAGLENGSPKPGTELKLGDAIPCRIALEKGKERYFCFIAASLGIRGWLLLVEELPSKLQVGVIRVIAPLSGCDPRVDEKRPKWLHLRIRPSVGLCKPSVLPSMDSIADGKKKGKPKVEGKWTLAFRDEAACKSARNVILEEMQLLRKEVERRIKPMFHIHSSIEAESASS